MFNLFRIKDSRRLFEFYNNESSLWNNFKPKIGNKTFLFCKKISEKINIEICQDQILNCNIIKRTYKKEEIRGKIRLSLGRSSGGLPSSGARCSSWSPSRRRRAHPELLGSDADLVGRGARHGHLVIVIIVVVVDDDTVARGQTRPREQSVKCFPCDSDTLFTFR